MKDVRDERDRLVTLMGNYLDFDRLVPVDLVPVMDVMMRVTVYTVWRGIKILVSLPTPEVWKAFNEARKRSRKNRQIVS